VNGAPELTQFKPKMGEWCYGAYSLMVLRGLHSLNLRWVDGATGLTQFSPHQRHFGSRNWPIDGGSFGIGRHWLPDVDIGHYT
jgi:hypothetical protein